ncbi:MAG: 30S ribosomal protein S12 methylthiotransferase RimO [Endomicrobium sp.]|jgi:ribosomal protein S12 methylthiotransferase|nr:30S ribosomal protein S12 methylthiotransferase RimO [Endomicrobium sp.]
MQKIAIITLGCPKNTVEAEYLLGIFQNQGFEITNDLYEANIAIIHTCSFIKSAKKESEVCIRNVLDVKKKTGLRVYVSGCLPQLLKEKMSLLFPDVDGFVGTGTLNKLQNIIFNKSFDELLLPPGGLNNSKYRLLSSNIPSTYLKIAEGCRHRCSFCIIPTLRGNYESRTIESVVNEAKILAENGIKELILIAQDTTSYGGDIYGAFVLDKLLVKLSKIKELKWIRLLYAHPSSITDNLLSVFKEHKNICGYMDIPMQHSSKNILLKMRRPLDTVAIVEKIKNVLPDIVLRTSIITGFPGETKKDVNELIDFLNQGYFLYVGVFEYSNQKEADSSKLQKHIDAAIVKKRRTLIENAQYKVFKSKIYEKRNNITDLFVENCFKKGDKYNIKGRSYFQSPEIDGNMILASDKPIDLYQFHKVKIKGVNGYNIKASLLD